MSNLIENTNGLLLSPQTIKEIELLGVTLSRFAKTLKDCACVFRSHDKRRQAMRYQGIGNPDAVFRREDDVFKQAILADWHDVEISLADFGLGSGITEEDIAKFVKFCIAHQLQRENGWDGELTQEEKEGVLKHED